MSLTKAKIESNKRYHERHDEIRIRVPKGQKKIIQDYAKSKNISMNMLIYELIKEHINNDVEKSMQ